MLLEYGLIAVVRQNNGSLKELSCHSSVVKALNGPLAQLVRARL